MIDPARIRAEQIAKEERKRFAEIANEVIKVLVSKGVIVQEIPRVVSAVTGLLNKKIDETEIEKILKL